jgi:glycosyltransferase involved in cell wall biosynthesis
MNEEQNLPHVLPRIPSWVGEVVLVDGNSRDATVDVARRLVPDIVVVNQDRPRARAPPCAAALPPPRAISSSC